SVQVESEALNTEAVEPHPLPAFPLEETQVHAADSHIVPEANEGPPLNGLDNRQLSVSPGSAMQVLNLTPEVIANIAQEAEIRIFRDQHGVVFAWVPVQVGDQQHLECHPIKSKSFLAHLLNLIRSR